MQIMKPDSIIMTPTSLPTFFSLSFNLSNKIHTSNSKGIGPITYCYNPKNSNNSK